MAKKEVVELNVEGKLQVLYQLQTTLSAIDEKRALRGELPMEVSDLEDELEGLSTRMEKIQNEVNEFEAAIKQKTLDIEKAAGMMERYKAQLEQVNNNREYDALTKEIEFQDLEIQLCQKKINEGTLKVAERKREEDKLREKARELELKIDERLLTSFKRIRRNARNGLGIVYVQRDACGGCFNKIPPQRQLDIKMHKKIIVCEYCGRILIDPELAGVKTETVVEEKPKRKRVVRKKKDAEDAAEA